MSKYDFKIVCKIPAVMEASSCRRVWPQWQGKGRAYENPELLISVIPDQRLRLVAKIELEGGARAEGIGFPANSYSKSRLQMENLLGVKTDPFLGDQFHVGQIITTEKNGLHGNHYISAGTYEELEAYIKHHGYLAGQYSEYLSAINDAARKTGQFIKGRGTHGLKHCFAQRFYAMALSVGKTRVEAEYETSARCNHSRGDVFRSYYSGRR
jgi:hypothetical protein